MKTIRITEKINFELLLTNRTFDNDTEMVNGIRYLTRPKHVLLSRICSYKIESGHITFLEIEYCDISRAINIITL